MPLGWRLAALVAAPLLVITLVAGIRLAELASDRREGREIVSSLSHASLIETAINRLQDERDATAQLLALPRGRGDPGTLVAELDEVRLRSDLAIGDAGLSRSVPPFALPTFVLPLADVPPATLERLDDLRAAVDDGTLPPADAMHVYSTMVLGYLGDLNVALGAEGDNAPARELLAYTSALTSAESFIQARAWGTLLVSSSDASPREWILLGSLAHTEEFFIDQARGAAPGPGVTGALARLTPGPSGRGAGRPPADAVGPGGVPTVTVWQDVTQPRADELRAAVVVSRARLVDDARALVSIAEREFIVVLALALTLVGLLAFGAWRVSLSIARPLERLAVAARAASEGDLAEVELPESQDAIGEIGRAYGLLDQYLHHVADAAEEIAVGDLTRTIKPRSAEDRLGLALRTMTNQLSSMVVHSRRRSAALEETVGELQETAARDPLTGLLNRGRFAELVAEAIDAAAATNSRFGILFMDLDGFKLVNDQFGHAAGDELLQQVSSRLLGALRVDDAVARLGGDEFTVLISNGFDTIAVEAVADQIIELVGSPYFVHGETLQIRSSIGLARYPEHGETVEELLEAADRAMYLAKNDGGNGAQVADAGWAA